MSDFISALLEISLQGIVIIGIVLLLRGLFKVLHIAHKYIVFLWMFVFFFLVFPWKISMPVGFWNNSAAERKVNQYIEELGTNGIRSTVGQGEENEYDSSLHEGQGHNSENEIPSVNYQNVENGNDFGRKENPGYGVAGDEAVDTRGQVGKADIPPVSNQNGENESYIDWKENQEYGTDDIRIPMEETETMEDSRDISALLPQSTSTSIPMCVLFGIWFLGVAVLLGYSTYSYVHMQKKLLLSIPFESTGEMLSENESGQECTNIFFAQNIDIPMVFDIFRPKIYLPLGLAKEQIPHIVAHERMHISRKDPLWKMLAYFISILHWFNPFVWFAYKLFSGDIEKACDEKTILTIGEDGKKAYAEALLTIASVQRTGNKRIFVAPICFDEGNVKDRVENISKFGRTFAGIAISTAGMCVVLFILLLTRTEEDIPMLTPTPVPSTMLTTTLMPSASPTPTQMSSAPPTATATPILSVTPTATPVPSVTPMPTLSVSPTATPTPIPSAPPTATATPILSVTPTATPVPSVTPMPTLSVPPTATPTPILAAGEVLLCKENFPDDSFREFISEVVDKDKNGILTLEERESLTELRNSRIGMEGSEGEEYYNMRIPRTPEEEVMYLCLNSASSLVGIQYFPKLQSLTIDKSGEDEEWEELYFSENRKKVYLESLQLDNMPDLESVQIISKIASVEISNAPKLQYLYLETYESATCDLKIKSCNAISEMHYYGRKLSLEYDSLPHLKKLRLFAAVELFTNNNLVFEELEYLELGISTEDEVVVKDLPKVKIVGFTAHGKNTILKDLPNVEYVSTGTNTVLSSGMNHLTKLMLLHVTGERIMKGPYIVGYTDAADYESLDYSHLTHLRYIDCSDMCVKELRVASPYVMVRPVSENLFLTYADDAGFFHERTEVEGTILTKEVNYQPILVSGVTLCDCTGNIGYEIDLNGDGLVEQLYSDKSGFYINGINQGIARVNYKFNKNVWNQFWLVDADESDSKLNLVLNTQNSDYWGGRFEFEPDTVYKKFGQYLASYDGELHLLGWSECKQRYELKESPINAFSDAEYDGHGNLKIEIVDPTLFEFRGKRTGMIVQGKESRTVELCIADDGYLDIMR